MPAAKRPTADTARFAPLRTLEGDTHYPPKKCHKDDAGWDLAIPRYVDIPPGATATIPLNLVVAIPEGFVGLILPRLWATAQALEVKIGMVDPGYRGELSLVVWNRGVRTACLQSGAALGQLLILPLPVVRWVKDEDVLTERTERTECP